jgi:hypothetical protein
MSIITRILPDTSDDSGGDLDPFGGFGTSWQGLRDGNDGTGTGDQLSSFEPTKHLEGTYSNLPVGVGRVNSMQVGCRAWTDIAASCSLQVQTDIGAARISVPVLADVPTQYLSATITTYTTKAQVDALGWGLVVNFSAHDGVAAFISELWADVDWDPAISGLKGLLFGLLGPLVAVGLQELPAISRELLRRGHRLGEAELLQAWREMREDTARRHFVLGAHRP